ncbi:competence protein CoiA [Virgibacillus necropolis]|uniref:competence protein CoiA n=1 Tax=Virgibacillus necropolis TaxID=163877 RepID=UPI00384B41DF
MLQAKLKNGKLITLVSLTRQEILKAKQDEFFCPICNELVLVKAGQKTVPHFAHRSKLECASHDYGEGPYHEQGKLLLYNWLKNQGADVELEKYIAEINQRPDLYVTVKGRKIAIEYQCARIPVEVLNQRNIGYMKAGITPIWILGAKHFQRLRQHHFKADQLILSFLHRFSPDFPLTLYFFCPQTLQFIFIQHIHLLSSRQAIGLFKFTSLKNMTFSSLFSQQKLHDKWLFGLWGNEKKNFRLRQSNRLYGSELAWHKWLYEKGTHKENLPSIVHLPVAAQYRMGTPLHNWQSRLCLDLLHPMPIGSTFSLERCQRILRYHPHQHFFLIKGVDNPIYEYLALLKKLQIIEEINARLFKKVKEIHFHKNIEESLAADARLMNQIIHCSTMD